MLDVEQTLKNLERMATVYQPTFDAIEIIKGYQKMEADFKKYIQSQVKRQCGPHACYMCKHRFPAPDMFCASETCEDDSEWEYGEPDGKGESN